MTPQTAVTSSIASARLQTAAKAPLPVFGATATVICAALGIVGAVFHSMDFTAAQAWSVAACFGAYLAGGIGPTANPVPCPHSGEIELWYLAARHRV